MARSPSPPAHSISPSGITGRSRPLMRPLARRLDPPLLRPLAGSRRRMRRRQFKSCLPPGSASPLRADRLFVRPADGRRKAGKLLQAAARRLLSWQAARMLLGACDGGSGGDDQAGQTIALRDQEGMALPGHGMVLGRATARMLMLGLTIGDLEKCQENNEIDLFGHRR